jgi:hypothetical protein
MTIKLLIETISNLKINLWFFVSFIETVIILYLLKKLKQKRRKTENLAINKQEDIIIPGSNLGDLFKSIGKSEALYNKLKKKIHEDRFPNDLEKKRIAGDLAMELNQFKNDYQKLEEIQQKAIEKLGLTFNN